MTYEEACQGYVNGHWPLCWCGLPEDEHDGREMDASGDMHRFNERRIVEPEGRPDFGEAGPRGGVVVVAASVTPAALSSPAPKTTDKQPASALTLLRAAHALLGHMDQAWISGKPVKQHLVELRSLRYRIEEALR